MTKPELIKIMTQTAYLMNLIKALETGKDAGYLGDIPKDQINDLQNQLSRITGIIEKKLLGSDPKLLKTIL